jgi:hypothetical protein
VNFSGNLEENRTVASGAAMLASVLVFGFGLFRRDEESLRIYTI